MSSFDPHGIYNRRQYVSHSGQIIQAKPQKRDFGEDPTFIDIRKFPKYVKDLETMGYQVYEPGTIPAQLNPYFQFRSFSMPINLIDPTFPLTVSVNNILSVAMSAGAMPAAIFVPEWDEVDSFEFKISLNTTGVQFVVPSSDSIKINGEMPDRGTFAFPMVTLQATPTVNDFMFCQNTDHDCLRITEGSVIVDDTPTVPYIPIQYYSYTNEAAYKSLKQTGLLPVNQNSNLITWGIQSTVPTITTCAFFATCTLEFFVGCQDMSE